MEEIVKKRGRKKTTTENEISEQEPQSEPVRKKRGRKKKWETTPFKNNYVTEGNERVKFEETNDINDERFNTNALNFGNLCIKVHDKESDQSKGLQNYFVDNKATNCDIILSSDEEDTTNFTKETNKKIKYVKNNTDITDTKLKVTDIRCYNCHHTFDNSPFYLPYDYSPQLKRYKLFGNFCSPNCVKSYSIGNKTFENKNYLIGQFYRKLFGPSFTITPAPNILNLDTYGGKMSIEEFRKSFYTNSRYTLNNINCKIKYIN